MPLKKKIVLLPYDFDTAIGINNEGSLVFSYNLEDTDTVDDAEVFNGQDSVLWNNLRKTFARELRTMYRDLRSQGIISYANVERMFEEHQSKWPAALFNEDSWFKYIDPLRNDGDDSYLSMMQGDKAEQRKWWLNNRFRYIDSKYNAGDALTDVVTLRGYAKANITITPYADIYPTIRYGSYLVSERGSRGNPTTLVCPLDRVNDTEIYLYSASQIASVGDLAPLKVGYANFSMATRLQSLKLGDADSEYSNRNLKSLYLGNNTLLRSIDVRNCYALGTDKQKAVDLSGCSNIEHVYFDNTAVASVALPNGGILKTLHLPSTVTDLTILNQRGITDFSIPSTENLTSLRLENVSSVVDSLSILRSLPVHSSVRLIGFQWTAASYAEIAGILDLLDTMRGIDERGENVSSAQIYGTIHVPAINTSQIRAIQARYHDITVTADTISYRVRFYNEGQLVYTANIASGNDCPDPVTAGAIETPYKPSEGRTGFHYVGWDGPLTQIAADTDLHAVFTETHAYEVKFQNYDGTLLYTTLVAEGATCPDPVRNNSITAPEKEADASYVYSFLGWDGSLLNVRQDRVLTAVFSQVRSYSIVFKNPSPDNTVLCTYYLAANMPVPDPIEEGKISTPTMASDTANQYDYVFKGWSTTPSGYVSGNMTFTARYDAVHYQVLIFQDEDGTELLREKHPTGSAIQDPTTDGRLNTPTKDPADGIHYIFWRWSEVEFPIASIARNYICQAMFRTDQIWTVQFKNYDNSVLDTQEVMDADYAEDPVLTGKIGTPLRSSTQEYDYEFRAWSAVLGPIRKDTVITAQFRSTRRSYRVQFFDGEELLLSKTLTYNTKYTYPDRLIKDGKLVTNWTPNAYYSYADTDLHAVWTDLLSDSWSDIIAASANGTYKERYHIGDLKLVDAGIYGRNVPMRLTAFDTKQTPDGETVNMLWCAFHPLNWRFPFTVFEPTGSNRYSFIEEDSDSGYLFKQNNSNYYPHLATGNFVITASQDTQLTITTYTTQYFNHGLMITFLNDTPITFQSGSQGEMTKTISLNAGEPVTIFIENWVNTQGTQGYARVMFNADCPLEITKTDNLPFRRVYASQDVQSYSGSDLRKHLEEHVFYALPEELQQGIKTVVNTQSIWDVSEQKLASETTHDRLWVPSHNEMLNSKSIATDVTGKLGDGLWHGSNGFGIEGMVGRSVIGNKTMYLFTSPSPIASNHGGSTVQLQAPGFVMICFGL